MTVQSLSRTNILRYDAATVQSSTTMSITLRSSDSTVTSLNAQEEE